ncbi:MAG: HAMP domain-containing sensor histidine kinase [Lachnospiraceae bacterium]|nr:HAMP domain-containing sensor histidine kinase [Lachnospiraceae bacterium]
MKSSLLFRFFFMFSVVALISYLTALMLGPQLFQRRMIREETEALCRESATLASGEAALSFNKTQGLDSLNDELRTIAAAEKVTILIFDTKGNLLIDTDCRSTGNLGAIESWNYAAFGPGRTEISTLFGHFKEDHLTAISPIIRNMKTVGYITLSAPVARFDTMAAAYTGDLLIILTIVLGLCALLFGLVYVQIIRPIRQIRHGASEIAAGHLDHRIAIESQDELGQLAHTLNTMSDEIRKSSEYQRTFISNVSHDFRSPLTSIKGFTEAMIDGTIPPEMHGKYLGIIQSEAERLEKLTRNTLALENLDRRRNNETVLEISTFDINEVLRNTAAVFEGSCRQKKISFSLTLFEDGLRVQADKEKIQQVIYNLIDNAVKFSDNNTTIYLETKIRKGRCEVTVRDEGIGIPEDKIDKIWDRFYKSDASRGKDKKGTGLGLSIVQEIILAHGETIQVNSTVDVGTRFRFTLPLEKIL